MFSQELQNDGLRYLGERIAAGDQQAFRNLFDHYSDRLIHFAGSIIRSKEGPLEVVDDVFIKL
jgi:DNA-directed RNA polymerase specialized sigma24 family protein